MKKLIMCMFLFSACTIVPLMTPLSAYSTIYDFSCTRDIIATVPTYTNSDFRIGTGDYDMEIAAQISDDSILMLFLYSATAAQNTSVIFNSDSLDIGGTVYSSTYMFGGDPRETYGISEIKSYFSTDSDNLYSFSFTDATDSTFVELVELSSNLNYIFRRYMYKQDSLSGILSPGDYAFYLYAEAEGRFANTGVNFNFNLTPVPVPPGVLLFGTALLGFGALGWRRKRRS
jgi:hypothetical protein